MTMTLEKQTAIFEAAFGGWISSVWDRVVAEFPLSGLDAQRDAFFQVLASWLSAGRVRFSPPTDHAQDPQWIASGKIAYGKWHSSFQSNAAVDYWNTSASEIISHMKRGWPVDVKRPTDPVLQDYFYDTVRCPAILWVDEDGKFHAS